MASCLALYRWRVVTVATAVAAAASSALAVPVVWQVSGTLTAATGQYLPSSAVPGATFSFLLHFDTAAPISNPTTCADGGAGSRCDFYGYPGLSFENIQFGGATVLSFVGSPANNVIIVRNNAPSPDFGSPIVDGLTWAGEKSYSSYEGPATASIALIMRGSENLDVVTDATSLPSTPQAGMLDWSLRSWSVCDGLDSLGGCGWADIEGQVNSISAVPEAGTWLLLFGGLIGLAGVIRRRRG